MQEAGTCGPYVPESQESLPPDPTHCTYCTCAKHLPASGVLHVPGAGKSYTMFEYRLSNILSQMEKPEQGKGALQLEQIAQQAKCILR